MTDANVAVRDAERLTSFVVAEFSRIRRAKVKGFTIDAPETRRSVAIVLKYLALEYIVVEGIIAAAALRRRHTDQRAQAVDEALRIGELRPAGLAPTRDEIFD